ncbi:GFA family protein, partial [Listeria monocytogenes]|nr:GFA family protein [Listeria monocytogenes]
MDVSGSCLCGKVTINLTGVAKEITVCHCSLCQKFHGGPMVALAPCAEDQMALQGAKWLRRYDSSEWAQRGF